MFILSILYQRSFGIYLYISIYDVFLLRISRLCFHEFCSSLFCIIYNWREIVNWRKKLIKCMCQHTHTHPSHSHTHTWRIPIEGIISFHISNVATVCLGYVQHLEIYLNWNVNIKNICISNINVINFSKTKVRIFL